MLPLEKARISLDGLSVGDAFGEKFFGHPETVKRLIDERNLPHPTWVFTDDTAMAMGIVEVLEKFGYIDQNELALTFARNYRRNPRRGYGGMAHRILQEILTGSDWKKITHKVFDDMGSFGNGGAMRVAPLGAFFSDDLERAAEQARLSAEVTHGHPEGQAGAIAVAVAAAQAFTYAHRKHYPSGWELLETVLKFTPEGETRKGIIKALDIPFTESIDTAVNILGNGSHVSAQDTVPFCLWCSARHIDDYPEALWNTVSGLGDRDTTCAIVGGIVSLSAGTKGIPCEWLDSREPLTINA